MSNSSVSLTISTAGIPSRPLPLAVKYVFYLFYGLVLFFGIIGNIIVFYVVGHRKMKRNSGDIYILSLACTDFLSSLVAPMIMLAYLITDFSGWLYGEMLCYVMPPISYTTMCASSWTLVFISFDRLRVISKPMTSIHPSMYLYGSIALIWLSSLALSIPFSLRFQFIDDTCFPTNSKFIDEKNFAILNGISVLCGWCIPYFIMMFVYYFTARALNTNTFKHNNSRAMKQRNKQNAKTMKMFTIVVVIFLILTAPYAMFIFIIHYMNAFGPNSHIDIYSCVGNVLFAVFSSNGCVNPLIYAKMHREINGFVKSALERITSFRWRRSHWRNLYFPTSASPVSPSQTNQLTSM